MAEQKKLRLFKYLMACTLLVFIGIITSIALAQWPIYSGSFYDSTDSSSFRTPYGNYPLQTSFSGLWSQGWENYNNWSYNDIFSPYSNSFLTSGSFVSPAFSLFNQSNANFPLPPTFSSFSPPLYTGFTGYHTFLPNVSSSIMSDMFNPHVLSRNPAWYPPSSYLPSYLPSSTSYLPSTIIPIVPPTVPPRGLPNEAPAEMDGEWRSRQLTHDNGQKMEGTLIIDRRQEIVEMLNTSLPLGEGSLTQFNYTPTYGESPISFKARFDSNYSVTFTGTADNRRPLIDGGYHPMAGSFTVEGQYVIKDNEGQIVDNGTFDLEM